MDDVNLDEQEMEGEALAAIFSDSFVKRNESQPFVWSVKLLPVDTDGDEDRCNAANHVGVHLVATLPLEYPESSSPDFDVEIVKGLAEEQRQILIEAVNSEAERNAGIPAIFACCEAVREWLVDNNFKGQDDGSMYAQMLRKAKEAEKEKALAVQRFETQKEEEEFTEAELEELAVRKRRAEGTPVTKATFDKWWATYSAELAEKEDVQRNILERQESSSKKSKSAAQKNCADEEIMKRRSGFEQFSGNTGIMTMEALERELESAHAIHGAALEVNEDLFDDDDDLDDLEFGSDYEDYSGSSDKGNEKSDIDI